MHVAGTANMIAEEWERRFELLFRCNYGQVLRLLSRLVGNAEEAEELVQEAFLRLSRSALLERPDEEVSVWLRRVALNLGYNWLRARRREMERLQKEARLSLPLGPIANRDPEHEALRAEETLQVRLALSRLPARQQACLLLRYEGSAYKEIAMVLGVAPSSVGTLLARAEKAFREQYER